MSLKATLNEMYTPKNTILVVFVLASLVAHLSQFSGATVYESLLLCVLFFGSVRTHVSNVCCTCIVTLLRELKHSLGSQ